MNNPIKNAAAVYVQKPNNNKGASGPSANAQTPSYPSLSKNNQTTMAKRDPKNKSGWNKAKGSKMEKWPDFPRADKALAEAVMDIRDPYHYIRDRPRPQINYVRKNGQ